MKISTKCLSTLFIASAMMYSSVLQAQVTYYYPHIATSNIDREEQSGFFFSTYGGSTNFWSNLFLQIPTNFINGIISYAIDPDDFEDNNNWSNLAFRADVLNIKDNGALVETDESGNYWHRWRRAFSFKARDMFRDVRYGLKFGWQPDLSPFGIYVSLAYQHRQFKMMLMDEWSKFRLNYVRPGIGIRITPFIHLLENKGWSPILEVGTAYNYNFKCKAPFDNAKDQFNNGITFTGALGIRGASNGSESITLGLEYDNYNIFNKDYRPTGSSIKPYKNFKTKHFTIFLSVAQDF